MNDIKEFLEQRKINVEKLKSFEKLGVDFLEKTAESNYSYNFDWLGIPIINIPQDIVALQEIIWKTKPDVIIETGVARGGSLIFSASMLQLLNGNGKVVGVDIDIRRHNRKAIEAHPLAFRINLIQGSSIDQKVVKRVEKFIKPTDRVMVILDSNHTHDHVLRELELYSPLVTKDCYCVVLDTIVEDLPKGFFPDRPWEVGDNPKTAVHAFLKTTDGFEIDENIHNKLVITVAPDGYLRCTK